MKRLGILLSACAFVFCAADAEAKNQIQVQIQIFKFMGSLPGKTSVDEKIWTTKDPPDKLKDKVTVFSRGQFEVGKDRLVFRDGRCFWNKTEIPMAGPEKVKLPKDQIKLVYAPEIVMDEHSGGTFKIQSKQPIQYFEKRDDGLFELKEIELPMGLDIEITEPEEKDGYILLTDIVMKMRSVERRERIEGVNLSIGQPILGEEQYIFYFRVRPGRDYGILIKPESGHGVLLIRLRASSTGSRTFAKSSAEDEHK
jgi:hypothetical protein